MSITLSPPESGTLPIVPWSDQVVDTVGHDPRSEYVEHYWLAVLGPSAVWLLRHLAHRFDDDPDGFELDSSPSLGLSIVKTLVESELGGHLTLGASPSGGTRADVSIPLD